MRLDPALAASLRAVAAMMAEARDPWWVIGSAAVVLLGAETSVADVDVLLGTADADAIGRRLGLDLRGDGGDDRFRSARHGRWVAPPVPVELMADLSVRGSPVRPVSRVAAMVDGAPLFHPDRAEMVATLKRFGRSKDLARAALLG